MDTSLKAFRQHLAGLKSASTARKYPAYAASFLTLMRSNGYENFADLPPGILTQFSSMLSNAGKEPNTVRVQVYAAKKYLDWVRTQGVSVPVFGKPELPKVRVRVRDILSTEDIGSYFRQVDLDLTEPVRTATMLLPCCGIRANEMVTLRLGDIHKARVKMRDTKGGKVQYKTTLFLRVLGKGDKERSVPLMEEGVEILTGYLMGWRRRQPGDWLFPSTGGAAKKNPGKRHITTRSLRAAVQKVRESMGMEFTPHTMRRTYVTMLYRKGLDLKTLANIAGHASIQTTINHYIATDPMDAVKALSEVGDSLTED